MKIIRYIEIDKTNPALIGQLEIKLSIRKDLRQVALLQGYDEVALNNLIISKLQEYLIHLGLDKDR